MMRRWIQNAVTFGLMCFAAHGCKPEVSTLTWDEIDVAAAYTEMLTPTGYLTYVSSPPFETYLGNKAAVHISRAMTMAATLKKLADAANASPTTADASDAQPDGGVFELPIETDTEKTSNNTNMFLEIACPGREGYAIGRNFLNGRLRIDSGDLSDFSLRDFTEGVHLLLSFQECTIPGEVINAETPAYLFGGFSGILLDARKLGIHKGEIRAKYAYTRRDRTSILINVKDEGTYRLDFAIGNSDVKLDVVSANGTIECHFTAYGNVFLGCTFV